MSRSGSNKGRVAQNSQGLPLLADCYNGYYQLLSRIMHTSTRFGAKGSLLAREPGFGQSAAGVGIWLGWLMVLAMHLAILPSASGQGIVVTPSATNSHFTPLWGVNGGPLPDPGPFTTPPEMRPTNNYVATASYRAIGVKMVRVHDYYGAFDMRQMYPNQGADPALTNSYNFTNSDVQFRAIVTNGFEPYFRLWDSATYSGSYAPTNTSNWVAATVQIIRHYSDTNLWGSNYLRYVEIGNEPDSTNFYELTSVSFGDLYSQAALLLKTNFPNLKVGGPGATQGALRGPGTNWLVSFVSRVVSMGAPLEFLSWHTYTLDPNSYSNSARFVSALLTAKGFTNAEQHVTEWHTPTPSTPEDVPSRTGLRGASIVAAGWIAQQLAGVTVSLLYRGNDMRLETPMNYGIFYANTNAKAPALSAQLWNSLLAYTNRLATTTLDTNLWALAGRDNSTNFAVLICNPSSNSATWNLTLSDARPVHSLRLTDLVQTGTNSAYPNVPYFGFSNSSPASVTNNIAAWGVQLFTFTIYSDFDHWARELNGLVGSAALATADPDHDGMSNYNEFMAGTDPNDPLSVFKITAWKVTSTNGALSWQSVTGKTYRVQLAGTLSSTSAWSDISSSLATNSYLISRGPTNQFLRVRLE